MCRRVWPEGLAERYMPKVSFYVFACVVYVAFGGMMFGYHIGISGVVTGMDDFLIKFFPHVHERKMHTKENNYCKYDDHLLQLFTSSPYLAAFVASFFAFKSCSSLGRKPTILMASAFYIIGSALSSAAYVLPMLILGRILYGIGMGFGNVAIPLFFSEIAPIHQRGAINNVFQLYVTFGILFGYTSNATSKGWRESLGIAALAGVNLFFGSCLITETPTSLVERAKKEKGKTVLKLIRGVAADAEFPQIDAEFDQIVLACERAEQRKTKPFRKLLTKPSVPALTIAVWMQIFQQFTGINAVMLYAPVLFQMLGYKPGSDVVLWPYVVNICATFVSIFAVDRLGRRKLLLQACVQMFISLVVVGSILLKHLNETGSMDKHLATVVVVFMCTFVMSFAWSWGPMGWLIPSEVFPVETKTSGFAIAVGTNMIFTFLIAQVFPSMLCHMRAYIFFFFAAWIVVMGLFVAFLVPETKGLSTEQIDEMLWKPYPIWKNFVTEDQGKNHPVMQQTTTRTVAEHFHSVGSNIGWRIGDGKSIKSWDDNWLGLGKLRDFIHAGIDEDHKKLTISNVIGTDHNWDLRKLKTEIPVSIRAQISGTLIPINSELRDVRIWRGEATGRYTCRSAYAALNTPLSECDSSWRLIWSSNTPNKIKCFLWQINHNSLMCNALQKDRNMMDGARCRKCGADRDDALHLLRNCPAARVVSNKGLAPSNWFGAVWQCQFRNDMAADCDWSIGVITDDEGNWQLGFAMKMGNTSITTAELWGPIEGLKLAWERRYPRLEIECDSKVVVKLVQDADIWNRPLGEIVKPWICTLKDIKRSGNGLVVRLAKIGQGMQAEKVV